MILMLECVFVVFKEMFAYKHPNCFSWLLLAKAALGAWFNVQNGVQEYFRPFFCLFSVLICAEGY